MSGQISEREWLSELEFWELFEFWNSAAALCLNWNFLNFLNFGIVLCVVFCVFVISTRQGPGGLCVDCTTCGGQYYGGVCAIKWPV